MDGSSHMIWNAILSLACGSFIWWMRGINVKIEENRKLVSRTREEIARDYALKEEVDKDVDKIMSRFDRVESKLDNLMERIIKLCLGIGSSLQSRRCNVKVLESATWTKGLCQNL